MWVTFGTETPRSTTQISHLTDAIDDFWHEQFSYITSLIWGTAFCLTLSSRCQTSLAGDEETLSLLASRQQLFCDFGGVRNLQRHFCPVSYEARSVRELPNTSGEWHVSDVSYMYCGCTWMNAGPMSYVRTTHIYQFSNNAVGCLQMVPNFVWCLILFQQFRTYMYMHMGTTGASNEPAVPRTFLSFVHASWCVYIKRNNVLYISLYDLQLCAKRKSPLRSSWGLNRLAIDERRGTHVTKKPQICDKTWLLSRAELLCHFAALWVVTLCRLFYAQRTMNGWRVLFSGAFSG